MQFVRSKFGNFPQEVAGQRSAHGWHFDNHMINGIENADHIKTFTGSVSTYPRSLGQALNARYYQLSTGRLLALPSYTGNPYDPWAQHLYSYCGNNPTNMIDPTGHESVIDSYNYQQSMKGSNSGNSDKYDPANWRREYQDNIKPLIQKIPTNLDYETQSYIAKSIMANEAARLKDKYRTCWTVYEGSFIAREITEHDSYQKLSELWSAYPDQKDSSLGSVFLKGFFMGMNVGATQAAIMDSMISGGATSPYNIRYSQDSIKGSFKDGKSVLDLVNGLKSGSVSANDVPAVRLFVRDGLVYTLDNRRLYAFQAANKNINYVWATAEEVMKEVEMENSQL